MILKLLQSTSFRRFISTEVRNVGIMAHIDAGKTTTTERMLYYSGYTSSVGEVDRGDTVMDYTEQERERGITVTSAAITFPWKKHQINLIDTPGHVDFTMEVERALRVLDGGIVILDASAGVQAQTITVWRQAQRNSVSSIVYINKMDKRNADLSMTLNSLSDKFGLTPLLVQMPLYKDGSFDGIIDLLSMETLYFDKGTKGKIFERKKLSAESPVFEEASDLRATLIDNLCEFNDSLAEELIAEGDYSSVPEKLLDDALREVTLNPKENAIVTLVGSSFKNIGVQPLLDAIVKYLPFPSIEKYRDYQFLGMAFKIVHHPQKGALTFIRIYNGRLKDGDSLYNVNQDKVEKISKLMIAFASEFHNVTEVPAGSIAVISGFKSSITGDTLVKSRKDCLDVQVGISIPSPVLYCSIEPPSMAEQKQLELALSNLSREDPSLRVSVDEDTGQTVLSGMGELHLEIIKDRIKKEYKVDADLGSVTVAYKETATEPNEITLEFEKSIMNRNQSVVVELKMTPMENHEAEPELKFSSLLLHQENEFALRPWQQKALKQGFDFAIFSGPVLRAPIVGVAFKVENVKIKSGTKDTFISAAMIEAIKNVMENARLMEPIMKLEVFTDEEIASKISQDLLLKRASLTDEEERPGRMKIIHALVPLSELKGYSTHIRTFSSGRAFLGMELSHYEIMGKNHQDKAINEVTGFTI